MEVLNYTLLRNNLKDVLDAVMDDNETVVINRGSKNAVLISLEEYNAWKETIHLLSTKSNRDVLEQAIQRDKEGDYLNNPLVD